MGTSLCIWYNKELWFQIGELIQELIILVKNCFLIDEKNHNNIWNLFGQDLFQFFEKFSDIEKEILPKTSYTVLALGILRFQESYNENKLCFLEEELFKNINIFRLLLHLSTWRRYFAWLGLIFWYLVRCSLEVKEILPLISY